MRVRCFLRELRHRQGLTLRQMETRTGFNRAALSLYERGCWIPPDYETERLEHAYGAPQEEWWPADVLALLLPDPKRSTDGEVYLGRRDGLVKIGLSTEAGVRVRRLKLALIATLPGGRRRERDLHTRFAHLRVSGEWFREEDELAAFIEELEVA